MAKTPKTVPTDASVDAFIDAQPDPQRRADCRAVVALMQRATGEAPRMWGSAIVGFGSYRSGTGAWPVAAFSPRKNDLTLYLTPELPVRDALLARLGKHKTGASCLYLKRLADVDAGVLAELVQASVDALAPQRMASEVN